MSDPPLPSPWILFRRAGYGDEGLALVHEHGGVYVIAGPKPGTLFWSSMPYSIVGDIKALALALNATHFTPEQNV